MYPLEKHPEGTELWRYRWSRSGMLLTTAKQKSLRVNTRWKDGPMEKQPSRRNISRLKTIRFKQVGQPKCGHAAERINPGRLDSNCWGAKEIDESSRSEKSGRWCHRCTSRTHKWKLKTMYFQINVRNSFPPDLFLWAAIDTLAGYAPQSVRTCCLEAVSSCGK